MRPPWRRTAARASATPGKAGGRRTASRGRSRRNRSTAGSICSAGRCGSSSRSSGGPSWAVISAVGNVDAELGPQRIQGGGEARRRCRSASCRGRTRRPAARPTVPSLRSPASGRVARADRPAMVERVGAAGPAPGLLQAHPLPRDVLITNHVLAERSSDWRPRARPRLHRRDRLPLRDGHRPALRRPATDRACSCAVAVVDGLVGLATMTAVAGCTGARSGRRVVAGMLGACLPDADKPSELFFGRSPFPADRRRVPQGDPDRVDPQDAPGVRGGQRSRAAGRPRVGQASSPRLSASARVGASGSRGIRVAWKAW